MEKVKTLIITILMFVLAIVSSITMGIYAAHTILERDYTFLEERYVELHSYMTQKQMAEYLMPIDY